MFKFIRNRELNKKGEEMMTFDQKMASINREEGQEKKKELNFEGFVSEAKVNYTEARIAELSFKAEINGHQTEGYFYFKTCDEQWCCWANFAETEDHSISVEIDGKEISNEAAVIFVNKYMKIFQSRANELEHEKKAPQSIHDEIAREKFLKEQNIKEEQEKIRKENEKKDKINQEKENKDRGTAELAELLK